MTFSERLRDLMNRFALSVKDICLYLDCPQSTAYSWLENKRCPPFWLQELILKTIKDDAATEKMLVDLYKEYLEKEGN